MLVRGKDGRQAGDDALRAVARKSAVDMGSVCAGAGVAAVVGVLVA